MSAVSVSSLVLAFPLGARYPRGRGGTSLQLERIEMRQELVVSSYGQIAQWELALEPFKHLSQAELDNLVETIDAFIFAQIDKVAK